MIDFASHIFHIIDTANNFLWNYIALTVILLSGIYFSIKGRFLQFKVLSSPLATVADSLKSSKGNSRGTNPIKLYFASVGGMLGLGNLVFVMGTVTIGGPGSLLWLWIASIFGMIMKYSEIYLGIKYRVQNNKGGYNGGPIYYLQAAFNTKVLSVIVAILLCFYGVEIFQFLVISETVSEVFAMNKFFTVALILILVLLSSLGGVRRMANICTYTVAPLIIAFVMLSLYIIFDNYAKLPEALSIIWHSAFQGYAPIGAFAGSSILLAAQYGASRAVYSGDIAIGSDSTVQSDTTAQDPSKHAKLAILGLFTDSVICTLSILVVLLTGVWNLDLEQSQFLLAAVSLYIPFADYFVAALFFFTGFTTVIAYMVVGVKASEFLGPKNGKYFYVLYAIFAFFFFSYQSQDNVILLMEFSGGLLMSINMMGVLKLRKEIKF